MQNRPAFCLGTDIHEGSLAQPLILHVREWGLERHQHLPGPQRVSGKKGFQELL